MRKAYRGKMLMVKTVVTTLSILTVLIFGPAVQTAKAGTPPEVAVFLPAHVWVPLEKVFIYWPWGLTRHIRVPRDAPTIHTKHWFSHPPFYLESSAAPARVNEVYLPVGYNELHAMSDVDLTIWYIP